MANSHRYLAFYLLLFVSPVIASENFSQQLLSAWQKKQPLPHISEYAPKTTLANAYTIQKNYVELRKATDTISGYKAGLTSINGQKKFNLTNALSGVLFSRGKIPLNKPVSLKSAGKLMLETEIGFILGKSISQPISDPKNLPTFIESVAAVIELPDLGYAKAAQLTGTDLIATNVAAHQYIVGSYTPIQQITDINQIDTSLSHNDQLLFKGKATDALGDQWTALQWLINQLLAQGYQLSEGDLLITGALGKMLAAQTGNYVAQFGPLGQIKFTIN